MQIIDALENQLASFDPNVDDSSSANTGYRTFHEFVQMLFYRNLSNFDSMVLLTGPKGGGKSSAGIVVCKEWCRYIGVRFDPRMHMAYSVADMMKKIDTLPKFHPICADESGRWASSTEWAKTENKQLRQKIAQIRTKHHLFILCFPMKIIKVERTYLDSFVNYWIDLYTRGAGAIFIKDLNPMSDAWRITDFKDIGSYNEFTSPEEIKRRLSKHPNFWRIIRFPRPSDALYQRYLAVREKHVYKGDSVLNHLTKLDVYTALMILTLRDVMRNDSSITVRRIMLHTKNKYDIEIPKAEFEYIIRDSEMLISRIREQGMSVLNSDAIKVEEQNIAYESKMLEPPAQSVALGYDKYREDAPINEQMKPREVKL